MKLYRLPITAVEEIITAYRQYCISQYQLRLRRREAIKFITGYRAFLKNEPHLDFGTVLLVNNIIKFNINHLKALSHFIKPKNEFELSI